MTNQNGLYELIGFYITAIALGGAKKTSLTYIQLINDCNLDLITLTNTMPKSSDAYSGFLKFDNQYLALKANLSIGTSF